MVVLRQSVIEEDAAIVGKEQRISFSLVDVHSQATFPGQGLSAGERGLGVQRVDNPCDTAWRQLKQVVDDAIRACSFVLVRGLEGANQGTARHDVFSIHTDFITRAEATVTYCTLTVALCQRLGRQDGGAFDLRKVVLDSFG